MAKNKKNPTAPTTPEGELITPTYESPLEVQESAPLEASNPNSGVAVVNLPAAMDAGVGGVLVHTNTVDLTTAGTVIVLSGSTLDVPDVKIEEPTYPAHQWHEPVDPPVVLPNDGMADEALIDFVHQRQGSVAFRLKRDLEDYWLMGKALGLLNERHGKDIVTIDAVTGKKTNVKSRWREDWLPKLGINHTSDHQLRVFADKFTLDEVGHFGSKTEALRACGFSIGGVTKAIEHAKNGAARDCTGQAAQGGDARPPQVKAGPQSKAGLGTTMAKENGTAAQAAPHPEDDPIAEDEEEDPIAVGEALVVTLGGAKVADLEAALSKSPFAVVARTEKRIVGLLWFAEDDYDPAKKKVGEALAKLRDVKKNFQVEARYLRPLEVIAL